MHGLKMNRNENPNSCMARVDNVVSTLPCVDVYYSDEHVNDAIVQGLTSDYDAEVRAQFNTLDLSRADLESIFKE